MPLFSVIIPVYNRAAMIGATLDSVFAQRWTDYEIIVVDDGSTDDTLAILRQHEARVRVLTQANSGSGTARNHAVREARGQYIALLDSDDLWLPWTLETFAHAIDRHDGPSMVTGHVLEFHTDNGPPSVPRAPYRDAWFADYLSSPQGERVSPSGVALRTEALRQTAGFPEDRLNAEDADAWLKLGTAPGYVRVYAPTLCAYRRHEQNLGADQSATHRGLLRLIEAERSGRYPGGAPRQDERRRSITCHLRPVTLKLLQAGAARWAWELYLQSFGWHLRERRLKYLLGFPARSLLRALRRPTQATGAQAPAARNQPPSESRRPAQAPPFESR